MIDTITILEIKSVEIDNEAARANVRKELRLLPEVAQESAGTQTAGDAILALKQELNAAVPICPRDVRFCR
jgi:hypothetical protein